MAQLYDQALNNAWNAAAETLAATERALAQSQAENKMWKETIEALIAEFQTRTEERDRLVRWIREAPHHKTCAGGETTDLSGAYWPHPCTCGRESLIR